MTNINKDRVDLFKSKLSTRCTIPLENNHDLSRAYTPGVAEPCKKIKLNKDLSFEYTNRGNMIAVVSDGTRVLGLGDIGPEAAMPVMEGKSVLFKSFADVDAIPICLDTKDPDEIIKIVKALQPSFAGINLEDFSSPKCYEIEDTLKEQMDIPVFHDDQHGTAIACCSALLGALRLVKKDIKNVKIVVNGAGAAGTAIAQLILHIGAKNMIVCNSKGSIYAGQSGLNKVQEKLAQLTGTTKQIPFKETVIDADVLLGVSAPGAFTTEIIKSMKKDAIVFAMANPVPECDYHEAKAAGAKVVGTGRSDFPNQVNNVKVFPGVFRGAIDVRARAINEEMKVAAVYALANLIHDDELTEEYVTPDAFDPRVAPAVAAAVAKAAMDTGVARIHVDSEEIRKNTEKRITKIDANS
ncbi:MAG: NAD-dependent malic enzyme [Firmicutes bacterium]|nr:NAD-dependent malic enzyme [Bacillota bacterium]